MKAKDMEFDPVDYYEKYLKEGIRQNAASFFDALIKKAAVDEGLNTQTADAFYAAQSEDKANEKVIGRYRALKTLLIVLAVIGILGALLGIYFLVSSNNMPGILCLVIGLLLALTGILITVFVVSPKLKALIAKDAENNKKVSELKAKCLSQLYPLNKAMDHRDFNRIVAKTTDAFNLDDTLAPEKLSMLKKLFAYNQEPNGNESVFTCVSGNIATNPFLRLRLFTEKMLDKVYVGTRVITWTEVVGSGKNRHVVTRTQTLTAQVVKPAPFYNYATFVVYGNQAAPDLTFSRSPSGLDKDHDDKDVERLVSRRSKEMNDRAEEIIKKGGSFQPLANTEFESLFGAFDRDNEVQYRLLFTPLAQQNLTELITMKEPYGDDFAFHKLRKINIVSSRHGKEVPDFTEDMFFGQVDIRVFRKTYVDTIASIFESLFFELAPVLAIPLYQQTDAGKYDPEKEVRHVSDYEAESFVNHMDANAFMHPETTTPQILKVRYLQSVGDSDVFSVDSDSFKAIPRVTYVTQMGGDGRAHDVAVQWFEYIPLKRTSSVAIRSYSGTQNEFDDLMNEKEVFNKEKEFYTTAIRSKNFLGFRLKDGYNYSQEEDADISKAIRSRPMKGV